MSQTAINLIAISVFLMTFSSLLGPLIHLSPTIPALATVTFLGIATLDNFSFEGKGGTIVLDVVARFSPEYRERIIHHEAGHFLVAHLLGIPVTGYTLSAWEAWKKGQPGQGGVTLEDSELAAQLETGKISAHKLDRYCNIWMAGIAAETLVFNSAEGGNDDKSKLREILQVIGFTGEMYQQKERFHLLQSKNLIQENWSSYEALVIAMKNRASVAECQQVILS
ncbi:MULTISPECIES: ATP-dependent Zn protease [unclassified Anabaena]|uniref:ATP-dependent Zn protease n=1 Tax=unclassified Anabaena TaxID=2619674 RepID=UPI00144554F7|nr:MULTISPECIES: ATP-dependent Zn protease [unclassified Anabaena]MTJ06186.1 ATP-dependent Zn protease [Anabaena sp. UHCC 0204]MTJ54723.1 ATP-dependent Zn protease [Anabaena sp. UHCC 0253]